MDELELDKISKFLTNKNNVPEDVAKELETAQNEFSDTRKSVPFWYSTDEEFSKAFNSQPAGTEGESIIEYFHFLLFVIFTNFLMTIWCFIGWIPHVQTALPLLDMEGMGTESGTYNDLTELLFLSSYQPSSDNVWVAMVVLGTITMIVSALMHAAAQFRKYARDTENANQDIITDIIEYPNQLKDSIGSPYRLIASYAGLFIICLVPIGINYGLLYVANHNSLKVAMRISPADPIYHSYLFIS